MWLKRLVIVTVLTIMSPSFVMAVNPLTNWQFVSDISGWTEGTNNRVTATWDASGYANGGDAKFDLTSSGRTNQIEYLQQNINITSIPTSVYLSLAWKKTYTGGAPSYADVFVTIVKPDTTTVDLWSNTSLTWNTWTYVSPINVTSNFDQTGTYTFRIRVRLSSSNNGTTQAYFDEVNLDITYPPNDLTVGTNSATVDGDTQITASATFTGDGNNNSSTRFEYSTSSGGPWTIQCNAVTGSSPRTCIISGLTQNTDYYIRVTHTDTDGVNGTNPEVIGPYRTTNNRVIPGISSANVNGPTQITVSAPFTGDANNNSSTDFERGPTAGGPWTSSCSAVTGASPRQCIDTGVAENSTYYYRITFVDPDGVNGTNPQVIGPYTTPPSGSPALNVGTNSAVVDSNSQITVTATFTGDTNNNSSTKFEYSTSGSGPWTVKCNSVTGVSPRQCIINGLTPDTDYYIRVTHTDPDGVNGTNPEVIGPYRTKEYRLIVGANFANVNSDSQITAFASFTRDENNNSSTSFDISTSAAGPWTNKCSGVAGASPRQCVITGLNPDTDYYIRITHTDPDGVVGTNPQVIGPYTTLPPSDTTPPVFSGIQLVYDSASGGSVTLEFNSATDPSPPIRYNVYFKESAIWSWATATKLSNVYVTSGSTHTYKYTVTGLQDGVQYTFGVRAEDRYGNEETNTVTLTAIPTDRTLRAGWNLICDSRIPDPAYTSPRQVFGDDLYPFAVSMYRWRSTGLSETSGYYIPVSQVQNGLGYWIYGYRNHVIDDWGAGTDEGSATSTENTAPTTSIPLQYGWNMIGNPYKLRVRLQDCQVRRNSESPVSFATAVSNGWIGNSIYFWTDGNTYIGEAFNELDPNKGNLKPWVGVWIQVTEGTNTYTLIVPKP